MVCLEGHGFSRKPRPQVDSSLPQAFSLVPTTDD
jgi:hypothetical protein